jgi:hypothetical protein
MKTIHKYHVCYPLNIYMGKCKEWKSNLKRFIHFLSFALGISEILKQVDKDIQEELTKK